MSSKVFKLLMFPIGSLNLALPVSSVIKVINYSPVYSSGLTPMGVTHLGDQEITVIDLHKRLFKSSLPTTSERKGYLLLAKNSDNEQFAILINVAPSLIDVPGEKIRLLPESYRRADTLEIASHVIVLPEGEKEISIFLLDPDQLVPVISSLKS